MAGAKEFIRESGLHGIWIALWSLVGWGGTLTAPFLLDRPLLLMVLAPRAAFVLLAAPTVALGWFLLLGTARLAITDANWFLVGRRLPDRVRSAAGVTGAPRRKGFRATLRVSSRLVTWLCRSAPLAALVLFLRPNGRYLGVAGAFGVGPRLAGVSSLSGTVVYLAAVHIGVGELF